MKPNRPQVTESDRAEWRQWAQARAQEAFRQGQQASGLGDVHAARRWLERARRISSGAVPVDVALALARLAAGDAQAAMALMRDLLRRFDFREGWTALAAAHRMLGDADGAARAVHRALSHHAPDAAMAGMMTQAAREAAWPGWCGLCGDGRLLIDGVEIDAASTEAYRVRLDGKPVRAALPRGWRRGWRIEVSRGSAPLLGSPVEIRSVLRTEGFVEWAEAANGGGLEGWLWHPGEPERVPCVTLTGADGPTRRVLLEDFAERIDSETPLARPRRLWLPADELPPGPWRLFSEDGSALIGSPLMRPVSSRRGQNKPVAAGHVGGPPRSLPPNPDFDVVIPVFRHLRRTLECIACVRATIGASRRVVVVEDASPEPALCAALDRMAASGEILLLRNQQNRGFPRSANRGIEACAGRDVILLNSDTLVAGEWAEALREAAYHEADIGTATPFSNDASILSYPSVTEANAVPDRQETGRLMALAASANRGRAPIEIPTGNGFCMYLRRDCLRQTGLLREDLFAQGYGEENDFCLRARHLGWRHVGAPGVYVGHIGNVSFGAARLALMRRNLDAINRLHPGYDALIQAHIAADPLAESRLRIDRLRFIGGRSEPRLLEKRGPEKRGAVLLITHAESGGVERVVQARARALAAQGIRPILLRPHDGGCLVDAASAPDAGEPNAAKTGTWRAFPNLVYRLPEAIDRLAALLAAEDLLHAEWHHWLGHSPGLRGLCGRLGLAYDIHVHDYALFCERIALVGPRGRYCGEPGIAGCEACIAAQGSNLSEAISPAALYARSAAELAGARAVIAPSDDAVLRIARHFPAIRPRAAPWEDDAPGQSLSEFAEKAPPPPAMLPESSDRARVCVIGGIGVEKGYDVLLACLRDVRARSLALDFVVVGHTPDDDALFEAGCLDVTGGYPEREAVALIRSQRCDLAFLPSIWPETWCFTLSAAWRAGLAAAVFDIGAQAERVRRTGRGAVLPLGLGIGALNEALLRLCGNRRAALGRAPHAPLRMTP